MRYVLFVLAVLGCDTFTAPPDAERFQPPDVYRALWQQVEQCSGRAGDFNRVTWYLTDSIPHSPWAAEWHPPHEIYVVRRWATYATDNYRVVRHEMLHDLLNTLNHPPIFIVCAAAELGAQ